MMNGGGKLCAVNTVTKLSSKNISSLELVNPSAMLNVWFQKISIPPPRKVTGISKGEGVSKREISEGRGVHVELFFQGV